MPYHPDFAYRVGKDRASKRVVYATVVRNGKFEADPFDIVIQGGGYSQHGGTVIGFGPGRDQHDFHLNESGYGDYRDFIESNEREDERFGVKLERKDWPPEVVARIQRELEENGD